MVDIYIDIFFEVLESFAGFIVPVFGLYLIFYFIGSLLMGRER